MPSPFAAQFKTNGEKSKRQKENRSPPPLYCITTTGQFAVFRESRSFGRPCVVLAGAPIYDSEAAIFRLSRAAAPGGSVSWRGTCFFYCGVDVQEGFSTASNGAAALKKPPCPKLCFRAAVFCVFRAAVISVPIHRRRRPPSTPPLYCITTTGSLRFSAKAEILGARAPFSSEPSLVLPRPPFLSPYAVGP